MLFTSLLTSFFTCWPQASQDHQANQAQRKQSISCVSNPNPSWDPIPKDTIQKGQNQLPNQLQTCARLCCYFRPAPRTLRPLDKNPNTSFNRLREDSLVNNINVIFDIISC